jgi:Zn-dependent peptidase ImmA (M78 family)
MLKRPHLDYHPNGHPVLSRQQIDAYAVQFLTAYFPNNLRNPSILSPVALLTKAHDEDGLNTTILDLGHESMKKRLGRIIPAKKLIILDPCLHEERHISLPFVVAHEVAHWLLHRDCKIAAIRAGESFPDDDEQTEQIDAADIGWTSLQWIEWQANKLAAALLIPKEPAIQAIYSLETELGINTQKGIIYENPTPGSRIETYTLLDRIAALFGVSKTVTRIRLTDLQLFQKQKPNTPRPRLSMENLL